MGKKMNEIPFMIDHRPIQRGSGTAYDWGYDGTITAELWRPIAKYNAIPIEAGYWVSSSGRIYSEHHHKILAQYLDNDNRPFVKLRCLDGKRRNLKVYRLVLEAWVKNPMPRLLTQINHRDGNRLNSALSNLGYTSDHYNKQHYRDYLIPRRKKTKEFYGFNSTLHLEEA